MSLTLVRGLYEYHWWANRRLFEATAALGEEAVRHEMGTLFVHVYGFDLVWLSRWRGSADNRLPRDTDFGSLAELRTSGDVLETAQRAFIDTLTTPDLVRVVAYQSTEGHSFRLAPPPTDLVLYHLVHTGQTPSYAKGNVIAMPGGVTR